MNLNLLQFARERFFLDKEENQRLKKMRSFLRGKTTADSTQSTIQYKAMSESGICVTDSFYSRTIVFNDINYKLASKNERENIFESYCELLSYFDSETEVQVTFVNQKEDTKETLKGIEIPDKQDEFNEIRHEYSSILKKQLLKGNNGIGKLKYLTFGINENNIKDAKMRLNRISTDVKNHYRSMGATAYELDGTERLKCMHDILNPSYEPFSFTYKKLKDSGLSTKDIICPTSFNFQKNYFLIGSEYCSVSYLKLDGEELSDELLSDLLDVNENLIINFHIKPIDRVEGRKMVQNKLTDVQAMQVNAQKQACSEGYDMDIMSSDIEENQGSLKQLLRDIKHHNEGLFVTTILIMYKADTKKKLDEICMQLSGIVRKHDCTLRPLDYLQEDALNSCLPLGKNLVPIERTLTTSSVAISVPFQCQELFQKGKETQYYGLNAVTSNLITANRKLLKNPNGLILGTPGAGKSFSAKREILGAFLTTEDHIIICDPEAEVRQEVA